MWGTIPVIAHVGIATTPLWHNTYPHSSNMVIFFKQTIVIIFIIRCLLSSLLPDWLDSSHGCIRWRSPSYCGENAGSRGPAWPSEGGATNSVGMGSSEINKTTSFRLVWGQWSHPVLSIMGCDSFLTSSAAYPFLHCSYTRDIQHVISNSEESGSY